MKEETMNKIIIIVLILVVISIWLMPDAIMAFFINHIFQILITLIVGLTIIAMIKYDTPLGKRIT